MVRNADSRAPPLHFLLPDALLGAHRCLRTIVMCAAQVSVIQTSVTYTVRHIHTIVFFVRNIFL